MAPLYQYSNRQKITIPNSNQSWTTRLAFDGTNGSTSIVDSSSSPKSYSVQGSNGTPYITTSFSKYGGSSLYVPGGSSNCGVKATNNSADFAFGTNNFTVECWIYMTSWSAGISSTWFNFICDTRVGSWNGPGLKMAHNGAKNLVCYTNGSVFLASTITMQLNTWYHVALVLSGGQARLYLNGQLDNSVRNSSNFTHQGLHIGCTFDYASGCDFRGYIDEFRILNGSAVYSGNFTP